MSSNMKASTKPKTARGHNAVKGKQGFQTVAKPETSMTVLDRPAVVSPDGLTDLFAARLLAEYPDTVFVDVDLYRDETGSSVRLRLRDAAGTDITPTGAQFDAFNEQTDEMLFTDEDKAAFERKNKRFGRDLRRNDDSRPEGIFIEMKRLRVPGSDDPTPPQPISGEFAQWATPGPAPASHTLDLDDDLPAPF